MGKEPYENIVGKGKNAENNKCESKTEICLAKNTKHRWKRRKCWLPAFSPSHTFFFKKCRKWDLCDKGLRKDQLFEQYLSCRQKMLSKLYKHINKFCFCRVLGLNVSCFAKFNRIQHDGLRKALQIFKLVQIKPKKHINR